MSTVLICLHLICLIIKCSIGLILIHLKLICPHLICPIKKCCNILLTMEASNTEIAQRKLPPGSLQSALCTLFFLRLLQSWWLSDNRKHMKAVWRVLGCRTVSLSSKPAGRERQGQIEFCSLHSCSITAAQCVELSLSNVSTWMGDHQRKHCVQLPGQARKLEEY